MKKAFGALELLIVIIIIIVLYFTIFAGNKYGRKNPFDDGAKLNSQQEFVNDKINEIENTKALKQKIEENLNKGY